MKVLVVEDDASTQEVIQRVLEDQPNLVVETVGRGDEAMETLDEQTVDVVLLDYRLPETDGLQILEQIRAQHPDVAVIFLTGEGSEQVAYEALRTGAVDYLTKDPDTYQRLPDVIRQAGNEWTGVGNLVQLDAAPRGGLRERPSTVSTDSLTAFLAEMPVVGVVVHDRTGEVVLSNGLDDDRADRLAARASALTHQSNRLASAAGTDETGAIHVVRGDDGLVALAGGPGSLQLVTLIEPGTTVSDAIEIVRGVARVVRDQLDDAEAEGAGEDAGERR